MRLLDRVMRYFGYVDVNEIPNVRITHRHDGETFVAIDFNGHRVAGWLRPWDPKDGDPYFDGALPTAGPGWRDIA